MLWQVAGLAFILYVGSPQSREGDERKEVKIDLILRRLDPQGAEQAIAELAIRCHRERSEGPLLFSIVSNEIDLSVASAIPSISSSTR